MGTVFRLVLSLSSRLSVSAFGVLPYFVSLLIFRGGRCTDDVLLLDFVDFRIEDSC